MKEQTVNNIVSLAALALISLPVGIACIILGFFMGDTPCILCWQERTAMVLVSLAAIFIIRYGLKPKYIGALIFASIYGLWGGLRHSAGHMLKDIGQGFGPAVFGVHTYVWVIVIFFVILIFAAIMLILQGNKLSEKENPNQWTCLNKVTVNTFLVIIAFNIVQAFSQTGPFPFIGQSDPYRMSFNPDKILWSTANWPNVSKLSARGSFAVTRPDFENLESSSNPAFSNQSSLTKTNEIALPNSIQGLATGISYSQNKNIYAVITDQNWVYFIDGTLTNMLAGVKIDAAFSVEISNLAGIVFDGDYSVLVTADHKSYVRLAYDPTATIADSYYKFMDGTDGVKELKRSRFATTRAKYNYIGSIAWDSVNKEYITVTLPDEKQNNFVVARLSGNDFQVNSEAKILGTTADFPSITGSVIENNQLLMLSHGSKQILVMNNDTNQIESAYKLSQKDNLQGLTMVQDNIAVLSHHKEQNLVSYYQR